MAKKSLAFGEPMPLILDEAGRSQIEGLREAELKRRQLMTEPFERRGDEQRELQTLNAENAGSYGTQQPAYVLLPRLAQIAQPDGSKPSEESILAAFNRKAREIFKRA
jgi:hypothetical protein